jgi:hypothetical protein
MRLVQRRQAGLAAQMSDGRAANEGGRKTKLANCLRFGWREGSRSRVVLAMAMANATAEVSRSSLDAIVQTVDGEARGRLRSLRVDRKTALTCTAETGFYCRIRQIKESGRAPRLGRRRCRRCWGNGGMVVVMGDATEEDAMGKGWVVVVRKPWARRGCQALGLATSGPPRVGVQSFPQNAPLTPASRTSREVIHSVVHTAPRLSRPR